MPQTVRVYRGRIRGRTPHDADRPDLNRASSVLISACACHTEPVRADTVVPLARPSEPNSGVTFVVEVDWEDALAVCDDDISLLDSLPVEVVHLENTNDL